MKFLKSLFSLSAALIVFALLTSPTWAQNAVPMLINYQGEIRSPTTGDPVTDGSYEMLLGIYDVEFGGTPLWEGTHSSLNGNPVDITDGIFNVILGSGTGNALDASVFNGADRWLEIRIGTEILEPRQRITSVAYSIRSEDSRLLDGKEASEFAAASHGHSGSDISSGVVSEEWIDGALTRDAEMDATVAVHAAVADAHHVKTTSFAELTDTATDAQIPDNITVNYAASAGDADTVDGMEGAALEESAEIDADVAAHTGVADAHHARYADSEAVAAMGAKGDGNPLNHDKTNSLSWGSITSIPAGFADGTDDDTTYTAGLGLSLTATEFRASFAGTGSASTVSRSDHQHDASYVNEAQPNSVTSSMLLDGSIDTQDLHDDAVTELKIEDGTIMNVDVNAGAAIAGTKINPAFGSQDVVTTGKIGVGTTSPTSKLQVENGTLSVFNDDGAAVGDHELARFERSELTGYPGIRLGYRADGTGVTGAFVREGGVGGDLEFGTGGYPRAMMIKNDGSVGIGTTSPSAKFEVVTDAGQNSVKLSQGSVITDNLSGSTSRYIVSVGGTLYWGVGKTHTGNSNFHVINYPSSRFDLTVRNDTGNVGIGTTSPQAKLDVNGDAKIAGSLTVAGAINGTKVYRGALSNGQTREFDVSNGATVEIILSDSDADLAATWSGHNYNNYFCGAYIDKDGNSGISQASEGVQQTLVDAGRGVAETFSQADKLRLRCTADWLEFTVRITQ